MYRGRELSRLLLRPPCQGGVLFLPSPRWSWLPGRGARATGVQPGHCSTWTGVTARPRARHKGYPRHSRPLLGPPARHEQLRRPVRNVLTVYSEAAAPGTASPVTAAVDLPWRPRSRGRSPCPIDTRTGPNRQANRRRRPPGGARPASHRPEVSFRRCLPRCPHRCRRCAPSRPRWRADGAAPPAGGTRRTPRNRGRSWG